MMKRLTQVVVIVALTLLPLAAFAAKLDSLGDPTSTTGHMPTLEELYDYLTSGTAPDAAQPFQEPTSGPGTTMETLKDIYDDFKALIDLCTATPDQVLSGQKFFRTTGTWGPADGVMPNIGKQNVTPGATAVTIAQGYHDGTGSVAGDADLVEGKIKSGVNIFGVTGTYTGSGRICSGTLHGTRWCDNLDGTVTDMTTGLIWLQKADWGGWYPFWVSSADGTNAHDRAAQLWDGSPHEGSADLSDGSVEGDWRLPTKSELVGLMTGPATMPP